MYIFLLMRQCCWTHVVSLLEVLIRGSAGEVTTPGLTLVLDREHRCASEDSFLECCIYLKGMRLGNPYVVF
jgi:hypothetical protein